MSGLIGFAAVIGVLIGGMWLFIAPSFQRKTTKRNSGRSTADDASSAMALQQDVERHHPHSSDPGSPYHFAKKIRPVDAGGIQAYQPPHVGSHSN